MILGSYEAFVYLFHICSDEKIIVEICRNIEKINSADFTVCTDFLDFCYRSILYCTTFGVMT